MPQLRGLEVILVSFFFSFTSSWRPISGLQLPFYFRLSSSSPCLVTPQTALVRTFLEQENYIACSSSLSNLLFSPTMEFLFCNQIILERYLMSDNLLTHVNLNLKSDIFTFWNALSIIINNQPSTSIPFGHKHVFTTTYIRDCTVLLTSLTRGQSSAARVPKLPKLWSTSSVTKSRLSFKSPRPPFFLVEKGSSV